MAVEFVDSADVDSSVQIGDGPPSSTCPRVTTIGTTPKGTT